MSVIKYGEWEIDVDIETTKYYYHYFTVQNTNSQTYRNYFEHCKNLTEQETAFFQSLGIKPECCNVGTSILYVDNKYPVCGSYCFAGKILNKPEETFMTMEELAEKNYVWDLPDTRVYVGRYIFTFIDPDSKLRRTPFFLESIPEGFIGLDFSIENISWLLDEEYEGKIFDPNNVKYTLPSAEEKSKMEQLAHESCKDSLVQFFDKYNISYKEMSLSEVENYMNRWFEEIVPKHNQDEIRGYCFSNNEYANYLWHAFSYGAAPCIDEFDAKAEFENIKRGEAVLIMNSSKNGYIIENASDITAKDLDEFRDVILTGRNFEWCYVHTHETYCGPYFYQKNKTFLKLNEEAKERIWSENNSAYFEIFEDIRGKYSAVFFKRDYDNFSNPFYRYFNTDERITGNTLDEAVEKANKIMSSMKN